MCLRAEFHFSGNASIFQVDGARRKLLRTPFWMTSALRPFVQNFFRFGRAGFWFTASRLTFA
jgi:hypothetical protein